MRPELAGLCAALGVAAVAGWSLGGPRPVAPPLDTTEAPAAPRVHPADPTDAAEWVLSSEIGQQTHYLDTIESVAGGFLPATSATVSAADQALATQLALVAPPLRTTPLTGLGYDFALTDLLAAQALWHRYRDDTAALFAAINPASGDAVWTSWLTEQRIQELRALQERQRD